MISTSQIIAALPLLSEKDRALIASALKASGTIAQAPKEPDLITDWLLSGIVTFLSKKGMLSSAGAYPFLRRSSAYKTYREKLPETMKYLCRIEKQLASNTRHRVQLAYIAASALHEFLDGRGILSVAAMLSQIDRLPEALEKAYPGYLESGMFQVIFNAKDFG